MGPAEICGPSLQKSRAYHLLPFVEEVFSLKFEDSPDYNKLRFLLQKVLLDQNISPGTKFDWIKEQNIQKPQVHDKGKGIINKCIDSLKNRYNSSGL